jgi:DNA integrity scanning protein DisA with diadenylate cyclase activity
MTDQYAGMTVNERLFVSGKMDEFDEAVSVNDVVKVIQILEVVGVGDSSIKAILDHLGLSSP